MNFSWPRNKNSWGLYKNTTIKRIKEEGNIKNTKKPKMTPPF